MKEDNDKLTASEALFGFCAWLTTEKEVTIMSEKDDASSIVKKIETFIKVNNLEGPRDDYAKNLIIPGKEHINF